MRVLFDQGTPAPLRRHLHEHEVVTSYELGWSHLKDRDLLIAAEAEFQVFITTDQNLRYQQNLAGMRLAIVVLPTTSWPEIQRNVDSVLAALPRAHPGAYLELNWGD